jgi:uncharacterized protein (DUF983 family)
MSGAAGGRRSTPAELAGGVADPAPPEGPAPHPRDVALKGLCPRCGARTLFAGWVSFADRCSACGLDLTRYNVGDGPAAFLTLILGAVVVGLAIWLELTAHPAFWVHILVWVPFTLVGVVASLRIAKGALLALEYRNAAREGRLQ